MSLIQPISNQTQVSSSSSSSQLLPKPSGTTRSRRQPKTIEQKIQSLATPVPIRFRIPIDTSVYRVAWSQVTDNIKQYLRTQSESPAHPPALPQQQQHNNNNDTCACRILGSQASQHLTGFTPSDIIQSQDNLLQTKSLQAWTQYAKTKVNGNALKLVSLFACTLLSGNNHHNISPSNNNNNTNNNGSRRPVLQRSRSVLRRSRTSADAVDASTGNGAVRVGTSSGPSTCTSSSSVDQSSRKRQRERSPERNGYTPVARGFHTNDHVAETQSRQQRRQQPLKRPKTQQLHPHHTHTKTKIRASDVANTL